MTTTYQQVQVTPPVQAAAYAVGSSIGGLLTFQNAVASDGGAAIAQGASVTFASGVVPAMDLILFLSAPTGGTVTDRVAVAILPADLAKIVGVLHLGDATLLGATAPSIVQATTTVLPLEVPAGYRVYGVLVTRAAVTLGSTTDVVVSLNLMW